MAKQKNGPIEVRSVNEPKPGWTEADAKAMLSEGYSPAQVARMTGFAEAFLAHQPEHTGKGVPSTS